MGHYLKRPIIDAVGHLVSEGAEVLFRRLIAERERVTSTGGRVIFLFDYEDQVPPEVEVETRVGILTQRAKLVGDCWKFDGLVLNFGRAVPQLREG